MLQIRVKPYVEIYRQPVRLFLSNYLQIGVEWFETMETVQREFGSWNAEFLSDLSVTGSM